MQIQEILQKLGHLAGINVQFLSGEETKIPPFGTDGELLLSKGIDHNLVSFPILIKTEARKHHLNQLKELKIYYPNITLVSETIPDNLKYDLRKQNIGYIDSTGNAFLYHPGLYIFIEGQKYPSKSHRQRHKAFTNTGLLIIFQLLLNENLVKKTYREISGEIQVSLDAISKTFHSLKELNFLVPINDKQLKLIRKEELLQRWLYYYGDQLKPARYLGTFRFLNRDLDWKHLALDNQTWWGGEPAAELLTNYLQPEILTIYTEHTGTQLIKKYKLVPDEKGNILGYNIFWNYDAEVNTVPPLLVYADLLYSGFPRNLETAERLYAQYLQDEV